MCKSTQCYSVHRSLHYYFFPVFLQYFILQKYWMVLGARLRCVVHLPHPFVKWGLFKNGNCFCPVRCCDAESHWTPLPTTLCLPPAFIKVNPLASLSDYFTEAHNFPSPSSLVSTNSGTCISNFLYTVTPTLSVNSPRLEPIFLWPHKSLSVFSYFFLQYFPGNYIFRGVQAVVNAATNALFTLLWATALVLPLQKWISVSH